MHACARCLPAPPPPNPHLGLVIPASDRLPVGTHVATLVEGKVLAPKDTEASAADLVARPRAAGSGGNALRPRAEAAAAAAALRAGAAGGLRDLRELGGRVNNRPKPRKGLCCTNALGLRLRQGARGPVSQAAVEFIIISDDGAARPGRHGGLFICTSCARPVPSYQLSGRACAARIVLAIPPLRRAKVAPQPLEPHLVNGGGRVRRAATPAAAANVGPGRWKTQMTVGGKPRGEQRVLSCWGRR